MQKVPEKQIVAEYMDLLMSICSETITTLIVTNYFAKQHFICIKYQYVYLECTIKRCILCTIYISCSTCDSISSLVVESFQGTHEKFQFACDVKLYHLLKSEVIIQAIHVPKLVNANVIQ